MVFTPPSSCKCLYLSICLYGQKRRMCTPCQLSTYADRKKKENVGGLTGEDRFPVRLVKDLHGDCMESLVMCYWVLLRSYTFPPRTSHRRSADRTLARVSASYLRIYMYIERDTRVVLFLSCIDRFGVERRLHEFFLIHHLYLWKIRKGVSYE